jgi:hypothetical protein
MIEQKTTQQIVNRFSFDDAPKDELWISKDSLITFCNKYKTFLNDYPKEINDLLKELEKKE